MPTRRVPIVLAALGVILTGCAPKPAPPRGMFDLSNVPLNNSQNTSMTTIPDHSGHQGGSGSFSTGIGGGIGQASGSPTGGF